MKQTYTLTALIIGFLVQLTAYSQIVVTNIEPQDADLFRYRQYAIEVDPGSSGANAIWDFTATTGNYQEVLYVVGITGGQTGAGFFPLSTMAWGTQSNSEYGISFFMGFENNSLIEYGSYGAVIFTGESALNIYSDPVERFNVPMAYQNTWSDDFAGSFLMNNEPDPFYTFTGDLAYEVDGYGYIGVYTWVNFQAVRVHSVQNEIQLLAGAGGLEINIITNTYSWFVEEVPVPVVIIEHSEVYIFGILQDETDTFTRLWSYENLFNGIDEQYVDNSIVIYPNPATDFITLDFDHPGDAVLRILNIDGKVVKSQLLESKTTVNVSDLIPGYYIAELSLDDSYFSKTSFIIAR